MAIIAIERRARHMKPRALVEARINVFFAKAQAKLPCHKKRRAADELYFGGTLMRTRSRDAPSRVMPHICQL